MKDKKQKKTKQGKNRPKIIDSSDLDPEIEAARKNKYKKKGGIKITEENENDI